jgi:hypothetical protein
MNEILRVTDDYDAILRDGDLNELGRLKAHFALYSSGAVSIETEPRRVMPEVIQGYSLDEGLVLDWLDYRIPVTLAGAFLHVKHNPSVRTSKNEWKPVEWKTVFEKLPA